MSSSARISQSADTVNQYVAALRSHVAPLTQDFMTRVSQESEQLKARLEKDLTDMSANLQPYSDMLVQLQTQLEELKKEVAPLAEAMNPVALETILLQKSQELKGQLERNVNKLQAQMVPYTEEMKLKLEQSVEDFQKSVIPLAQSFELQLNQKTQEIQQNLVPLGEELKTKLEASAQDLETHLTALWESFTKKTQ